MKKLLLVCLTLIVISTALTPFFVFPASGLIISGNCGADGKDNVTWTIDTEKGILTISGTGEMGYFDKDTAPWLGYESYTKTVIIENGVTSLGNFAFWLNKHLSSITIPRSMTSIGDMSFFCCSSLTNITVEEGNPVYHSEGNCLIETASKTLIAGCHNSVIPVDGSVTSIGRYAFSERSNLTSLIIPNSVESIGAQAFNWCENLTSITIPSSMTSIHEEAFLNCSNLKTVYNCSSLNITKRSKEHGYVAYHADNVYRHRPGTAATCTAPQICTACGAVLENALGHNVVTIASTSPTCVDSGLTGREQCTVCEGIVVAGEVIAPLGHAFALITSKGIQCSRCSVVMPYDVALFGVRAILIAAAGVVVLLAIIVIIVASKKRSKKKNIIIRTTELEHLESKTRR